MVRTGGRPRAQMREFEHVCFQASVATNLTRFNPFKSLSRLDPGADFEISSAVSAYARRGEIEVLPNRLDVSEDDQAYRVAEIPGSRRTTSTCRSGATRRD
jgi:hypothetical protein